MSNKRALAATRSILMSEDGVDADPIDHVEAIALVKPGQARDRDALVDRAAQAIAAWPEPGAAVDIIANAYFVDIPQIDTETPGGAEIAGEAMSDRERLHFKAYETRRRLRASNPTVHFKDDLGDAPAKAHGPMEPDPEGPKIGPLPKKGGKDRRTTDELENATDVLALAVQREASIAPNVEKGADMLMKLAARAGGSTGAQLQSFAERLRGATKAKGTIQMRDVGEDRLFVQHFNEGHPKPELVTQFSREWEQLSGHGAIRMSKQSYIEQNMRRTKSL